MKKMIIITVIILVLFITTSLCLNSHMQPLTSNRQEKSENSSENQRVANTRTTEKSESRSGLEAENQQENKPNNSSIPSVEASQNENAQASLNPPDGHIYQTSEAPYPYTPTFSQKKWNTIPINPPKTNNLNKTRD